MQYAVKVFYRGKNFFGYQRQPKVATIEGVLIETLEKTNHISSIEESKFRSASRTDRNVNAIGNVFSFDSIKAINLDQINAELRKKGSIVCWAHAHVEENFSPRYPLSKKYWYVIPNSMLDTIDVRIEDLENLCIKFEGVHDFRLFCKRDHRNTLRKLDRVRVIRKREGLIIEFVAPSFLWEQIRRIVSYILNYNSLPSTLKNLDMLLKPSNDIESISIQPADPNQLILVELKYPNIIWKESQKAKKLILEMLKKEIMIFQQELAVTNTIKNAI
ncbi:MAG: hypothetical protein ACTSYD_10280 [Candidatus Heimdallarchaeaceae archaeon]